MAVTIRLFAMYELTADGTGATGLTVTVDIDKFAKSDGTRTRVTTGGSAVEGANGIYHYAVANVTDLATHDYIAVFKTAATTVKTKHFAFLLQDLIAAATQVMANLDDTVTSRLAAASYTTPPTASANASQVRTELATELARIDMKISDVPTAGEVADGVWDEALAGHVTAGSAGALLGSSTDPLSNTVPGTYVSGTAGYVLGSLTPSAVTIVSPVASSCNITLMDGDDYLAADGRSLDFIFAGQPSLTGATIALRVQVGGTVVTLAGSVLSSVACRVEVTSTQVASIGVGIWTYDLSAVLGNGHTVTLASAALTVVADV